MIKIHGLPDEVEMIANYFKRSITYYFDKDEGPTLPGFSQVSEPGSAYQCPVCIEKQQEIDKLSRKVIEIQEKYSNCLEELLGKKENRAKNSA